MPYRLGAVPRLRLAAFPHVKVHTGVLAKTSSSGNVHASSVYQERETHIKSAEHASSEAPIPEKELSRRQKISRANKGKVPWNKGRHMSEEMKAKISQRTYEAMQRPDVRERMKQANANRAPHSDEVRKRIREVLRKRADDAKVVIKQQTALIVSALAESADEEERDIAARRDAEDVIGKLAWRVLHRDFEEMFDKWEKNVDGFRDAVKGRFRDLKERKVRDRRSSVTKRKKPVPTTKAVDSNSDSSSPRSSRSSASVLNQAEEKIASVSAALTKLQGMKVVYKDDPDNLQLVEEKERQTAEMLERLQEQVDLLRLESSSPAPSLNSNSYGSSSGSMLPWSRER